MSQYSVAVIVGSLRRESINRKLANGLIKLGPADFSFQILPINELPLYNQDDDANPAAAVTRFKDGIAASRALLFVTPEYNRSMPGVLKNAIDHGSRPNGKNSWKGKPGGVLGASPGPLGTAASQQHLRNVLAAVDVAVMPQPEVYIQAKDGLFDADGNIGPASKDFLQKWMDQYVGWVKKLAA